MTRMRVLGLVILTAAATWPLAAAAAVFTILSTWRQGPSHGLRLVTVALALLTVALVCAPVVVLVRLRRQHRGP